MEGPGGLAQSTCGEAAKTALERELRKRSEADHQVLCAGSGVVGLEALEQIGSRGGEGAPRGGT
jgi:hypothetical protein